MRILVIVGFVLFFLSVTIPFTSLASAHPCASPTPPSVTGTPVQPSADAGNLFINEVLLTPHATWNCSEVGSYTPINDAWVEIYNSQDVAYDLYGVRAALDSGPGANPFYFPPNSVIAAHSFLVVFPRTDVGFLSSETSTLRLLISGLAVDDVSLPSLPADTSYARSPDGSNTWQLLTTPTIDASNPSLQMTATPTSVQTITPHPSATPHHTSATTPTPYTSRKHSSGGTSKQDSPAITTQTGSDAVSLVDGSQPTWNRMSIPVSLSASPTTTTTTATSDAPMQTASDNNNNETLRKTGITLLAILLAGSLIWCGKLLLPRVAQKRKA